MLYFYVCFAAENRVVLRNANIVKQVMMFLAVQKYQELHVFAVMLLTSCVEDADIVKVTAVISINIGNVAISLYRVGQKVSLCKVFYKLC